MKSLLFFFLIVLFYGCQITTQPINFGKDGCEFCKMTISDNKFGAEIVTTKSKVYKFDCTECLIHFIRNKQVKIENIKILSVINTAEPGNLIDADSSFYLHSEKFPSPMGANISAYRTLNQLNEFKNIYEGEQLTWEQLKNIVK